MGKEVFPELLLFPKKALIKMMVSIYKTGMATKPVQSTIFTSP
jgi:hypothetical protein